MRVWHMGISLIGGTLHAAYDLSGDSSLIGRSMAYVQWGMLLSEELNRIRSQLRLDRAKK